MKYINLFLLLFYCFTSFGQTQQYIDKELLNIKSVPIHYQKSNLLSKTKIQFKDEAYLNIKILDTSAIPFLISKLGDTTLTSLDNSCLRTKLKVADLALFLINDIEQIPYAMVTGGQYCTFGECGILPDGFLYFVNSQRLRFKKDYTNYYYSIKHKEWLNILHHKKAKKT